MTNCIYCKSQTGDMFESAVGMKLFNAVRNGIWKSCDACNAAFCYDNQELIVTNLYCRLYYNNKVDTFRMTLGHKENVTELYSIFDFSKEPLLSFDMILDVNPSNMANKIKTMLVFS